jgi:rubrerythrin
MGTPNLLDAVRVVKENERLAAENYAGAANQVKDSMGKKLFEVLSEFEKVHYAQLAALEKSLQESGDFAVSQGKEFALPQLETLASNELAQGSLAEVITKAMELEKRAEKTYTDLAERVSHLQGHDIFVRLAEQENRHYLFLRDAYWALSDQRLQLR